MRVALGWLATGAALIACASFTGTAALTDGDAVDAGDAGQRVDDAGVAPLPVEDSGGPVAGGDAGSDAGPEAPPGMVLVDMGYAIDAHEVTVTEWAAFKTAHQTAAGIDRSPVCAGRSLGPVQGCSAGGAGSLPQTCVTWCDAEAFCNANHKRMCGQIGTTEPIGSDGDARNSVKDEWARACAGEQSTDRYPYAGGANGTRCNTSDLGKNDLVPVGTLATCEGGLPGLFDMSGNAGEWEACYDDGCLIRGGSYEHKASDSRCDVLLFTDSPDAEDVFPDVGFRCCVDL